jgi:hypothetical protein
VFLLFERVWTSLKLIVFILEIDLTSSYFFWSLIQVSDDTTSTEAWQEGKSAQDPSRKIMASWTFDIKFPLDTQFTFGSLTFTAMKDGEHRLLPPGPAPERRTPADGQAPWSLMTSSTSGGACSGLDPFVGLYIYTTKIVRAIPVVMCTLRPFAGASSSSSSTGSHNQESSYDYLDIGVSACGDSTGEGHLIFMVAPNGDPSHNNYNRYPTIGRLKASNAQLPDDGTIQNLNPDFNVIRIQTIMESI